MMDFLLTRTDDHVVLGVRLTGFDVVGSAATAGSGGGRILLVTTPQHVDEQTVSTAPGDDVAVDAELSGTSRVTFQVAAGTTVELSAGGVLSACTDVVIDGTGATRIELPTRLAFEPGGAQAQVSAAALSSPDGSGGLWLTRFTTATSQEMALRPLDPGLAGQADGPISGPLSPQQRVSIVDHCAVTPARITRLELTSLGGSLTADGQWDDLQWSHRTTLGRDQFVRTDERVLLYPFGFAGVLTTITERDPDANGVAPGEPAALYRRVTLRLTDTVLTSGDGTALRRTFPFARVECLGAVFGGLAPPVPDYTFSRVTPDVAALQQQLDGLIADRDQARAVWGGYVDGRNRTPDDLARRGDPTELAYLAAYAAFEQWSTDLDGIQNSDALAAPYLQRVTSDNEQISQIEQNAAAGGLSDADQEQIDELEQDAQESQQEAQQYYVDPGYRQQVYANYNSTKSSSDALWAQVQQLCATQPRDVSDAVNLGDDNPDVSGAAQRWQGDVAAIATLQQELADVVPLQAPVTVTAWPTSVSGQRVSFPVRFSRDGQVIDTTMPMMIIYDLHLPAVPAWDVPAYDALSDPQLPAALDLSWAGPADTHSAGYDAATVPPSVVDLGGALFDVVGAASPLPSDRQVINSVNIVAARADQLFQPSLGRLAADGAQRWGLAVGLPALQKLAGDAVPGIATSAVVGFAADYVANGERAAALFETVSPLDVDFSRAADRSGGLAALQLLPDCISREHGPAQLAALVASPDPAALIGDAAGLLGFRLTDLIKAATDAAPPLTPPAIVSDLADAGTPVVTLTWQVPLQDLLAFKTNGTPPTDPTGCTHLDLKVVSRVDGTVTDCVVNDFALQFPFDDADALIRLSFDRLTFHQQTTYGVDVAPGVGLGADPSVSLDASGQIHTGAPKIGVQGFDFAFCNALKLLAGLQDVVALAGKQPDIKATPKGVSASFALPVPDVGCGVFSLSNVTFHSMVDVPFDGSSVTVDIGFASRDRPFALSVLAFSGGGYIDVSIDADGPRVDASLEFGASVSVDFFVAEGEAHVLGGVQYLQQGDQVTISGYLRIGGSLEILSLVSVSVELRLALTYADEQLVGRATLVLEIDLTLWSDTVEIDSGPWVLAGGATQTHALGAATTFPRVEDALAAVDAPVTADDVLAWRAYRATRTGGATA